VPRRAAQRTCEKWCSPFDILDPFLSIAHAPIGHSCSPLAYVITNSTRHDSSHVQASSVPRPPLGATSPTIPLPPPRRTHARRYLPRRAHTRVRTGRTLSQPTVKSYSLVTNEYGALKPMNDDDPCIVAYRTSSGRPWPEIQGWRIHFICSHMLGTSSRAGTHAILRTDKAQRDRTLCEATRAAECFSASP
jgi:hypothetical protein